MAGLVLGIAGAAIGAEIGGTILGISAASIGGLVGSVIGGQIDSLLFAQTVKQTGPRLADTNVMTAAQGTPIWRVDGYMRLSGQLIWRTNYKETKTEKKSGKGLGGPSTDTTTYSYTISIAVGLCAGIVTKLGRIWADGNLLDASKYTIRFYPGTEDQTADPLMEEIEGAGNNSAFRGLAYVIFEDMDITKFGRIPQFQFEVVRSITADRADALENVLLGVDLIPGAGEFVYSTDIVSADNSEGTTTVQNKANSSGVADVLSSLDDLEAIAPNLQSVSIVTGWFGDDLRAGHIKIKPAVEYIDGGTGRVKQTYPVSWKVDGIARADAYLVSQVGGKPAFGGTPSDNGIVQLIQNIKSRGWRVNFYPFLFLDIPSGNSLPNPYSDNAASTGQAVYPWRGHITCSPAAGYVGTVDKTATAGTQVSSFFGSASASDFSVSGTTVSWTGGDDWGWRRMVLHYAKLCAAAGGVDTFIIGSELRGLTRVRSNATTYPAVAALKTLAADVKAIFTAASQTTAVSYSADWSEYNNHQTGDAPGAVLFNLDPLWSDPNIDFVGIDNYMPLADWRDGTAHLDYDAVNGPTSPHDRAYLQGNILGGEDYDWYYASQSDRDGQTRTNITDGLGKPWVFRSKDLPNWWGNLHYDRAAGTESGTPTGWVADMKPIRFVEIGCPAVDKGANEPNVFFDPKSSESALPYYSTGQRDDLMQRAFLEAHLNYWTVGANNPDSGVYDGKMLDTDNICAWCWDARPFPFFPARSDLWGDAGDYDLGHWLNGRLGAVLLSDLVAEICDESGFADYDVSNLSGLVTGYARTATMSGRDELNPLAACFFFDGVESQGQIRFRMRGQPTTTALSENDLVVDPNGNPNYSFSFTRAQDDDLPRAYRLTFIDAANSYTQGVYEARRLVGNANEVLQAAIPLVADIAQIGGIGDKLIMEAWQSRETGSFALAPYCLALDPSDEVVLTAGGRARRMRISEINDTTARAIAAVATDPSIYEAFSGPSGGSSVGGLGGDSGRALLVFADLPILASTDIAWAPHLAVLASPWPGAELLYRSASDSNYEIDTTLSVAASIGETTSDLYSGPVSRWDGVNTVTVRLYAGSFASLDDLSVLNGANAIAIQNADGEWEILQFATATLAGAGTWTLSRLLRGQLGSGGAMRDPVAAGARAIVLDASVVQSDIPQAQYNQAFNYLWGPLGKDISDPAYQGANLAFDGIGLRPYAPCHVSFLRINAGLDIQFVWVRRDRDPASDGWDQTEIPMSEQTEAYEVEILDPGDDTLLRTIRGLTVPSYLYVSDDQVSDFGSALVQGTSIKLRIYQMSAVFGRGVAAVQELFL